MTTIDESQTAKGYTPAAQVPQVFGQARTIEGIVIHHWGNTGQTHDSVVNFFVNGPGATSAHFVASAGRINCLVSPPDAAWHCPGKNATHIGIECRPEATDADYATVAELVRTLRNQYGPLPLSMHRDWYATACPGVWDLARIDQLAGSAGSAAINPQSTTAAPPTAPATTEEDALTPDQMYELKRFIQDDAEKRHTVTRNFVTEEVARKIEDSAYSVKVFTQTTDNANTDRAILDNREVEGGK